MPFSLEFVQRVLRKLDPQIKTAVDAVAGGVPADYAAYRETVGYIRGLRAARAEFVAPFNQEDRAQVSPSP